MSLNAATIEVLIGKGMSAADLLDVARATEKRSDNTAAVRMRRMRAKKKAENDDVTPVTVTGEPPNDILNPTSDPIVSDETIAPLSEDSGELTPDHVAEAWNDLAAHCGLKEIKLTADRRAKLRTRIKQFTIAEFTELIAAIERSPFLRGDNDRGWKARFDWVLEPKNFRKIIEGTYDR